MITKEQIKQYITEYIKQIKKDEAFADALGVYFPDCKGQAFGNNNYFDNLIERMWMELIEGVEYSSGDSWLFWFYFECDFGKTPQKRKIDDKVYVIDSIDSFVDFFYDWINHPNKLELVTFCE